MANQSMPEHAVPFPRFPDQATCPDLRLSDTKDVFSTRSSATKVMVQQFGHPTARPHSLRWLQISSAHGQDSAPLRFPSIASASTYTSSLHHPDETYSIRGEDVPGSEYEMIFPSYGHPSHRMLSQRVPSHSETQHSALRQVPPPFSRKRSTDLSSLNSAASLPSSPITPNTPVFVSNPAIVDFKETPFPDAGSYSNVVRRNLLKGGNVKGSLREETPSLTAHSRRKFRDRCSEREPVIPFYPNVDLSLQQLQHARNLDVLDHEGMRVQFGDLWQDQPTCVIFIRHLRCAYCMDYMQSIKEQVEPDVLDRASVRLVIISNSSPAMIKSYGNIFKLPFPLYTDPTCALYRALGMTLRTTDSGPDSKRGSYIRHGAAGGIAMVVKNTFKTRILLHKGVGDAKQLGGEFVLGPGLRCSFVSRMHNTRSHAPVRDLLSAVGVQEKLYPEVAPHMFYDNEAQWMKDRETDLKRIQARKGMRRGFMGERRDSDLDRGSMHDRPIPQGIVKELGHIRERPDNPEKT